MSENENKYDISKHPLIVIALAVIGTFGFSYQFVLPILTAKMQNDVEKIPSYEKKIKEGKLTIEELEKKLKQVESELNVAQNANLFTQGSPYPVGLGKVKIGDSIDRLLSTYDEHNIEKSEEGYWKVKNAHSIFNHIIYYFDEKSPQKEITHIAFANNELVDDKKVMFLKEKLEDTFGAPKLYKRKGFYTWEVAGNRIYLQKLFQYVLMERRYVPGYWLEE